MTQEEVEAVVGQALADEYGEDASAVQVTWMDQPVPDGPVAVRYAYDLAGEKSTGGGVWHGGVLVRNRDQAMLTVARAARDQGAADLPRVVGALGRLEGGASKTSAVVTDADIAALGAPWRDAAHLPALTHDADAWRLSFWATGGSKPLWEVRVELPTQGVPSVTRVAPAP